MTHNKIEIGFGVAFDKDHNPLPDAQVQRVLYALRGHACGMFGGCTLTPTEGDWYSPAGIRFSEKGYTLFFFLDARENPLGERVKDLVWLIKRDLNQEAVAISVIPCDFTLA